MNIINIILQIKHLIIENNFSMLEWKNRMIYRLNCFVNVRGYIMNYTNLSSEKEVIEKKAQKMFQNTYAAIISNDVNSALFNLGSFSAYVGLLGTDYRADSRYNVLANLILDKFDINMDAENSIQH